MVPPELYGPLGLLVATTIATVVLWRKHDQHDEEVKADRDYWRDLALRGAELADKATTVAVRKRSTDV